MKPHTFSTVLIRPEGIGTWTYLNVPAEVLNVLRKTSGVKVTGTINGIAYRCTLLPHGDGSWYMVVNKTIRDQAGVHAGDTVLVTITLDTAPRVHPIPGPLKTALKKHPEAAALFDKLSSSHKKEYIEWILSAKKDETKARRIESTITMLSSKKSPKQRR